MADNKQPLKGADVPGGFIPNLAATAQRVNLRTAVTLSLGGILISGELIDAKTYFDDLVAQTQEAAKGVISADAAAALTQLFQAFADRAGRPGEGDEHSEGGESRQIYLRNAKVYHPSGPPIPAGAGVLWRVRLDAVDGLTLGLPAPGQAA